MHRISVDLPEPVTSIRYSLLTIRPFAFNADATRLTGARLIKRLTELVAANSFGMSTPVVIPNPSSI
jgi:hypothetical protein